MKNFMIHDSRDAESIFVAMLEVYSRMKKSDEESLVQEFPELAIADKDAEEGLVAEIIYENPKLYNYVANKTDLVKAMYIAAMPKNIDDVKPINDYIIETAFDKNPKIVKYIDNVTDKIVKIIKEEKPELVRYIPSYLNEYEQINLLTYYPKAIAKMKGKSKDFYDLAVKINPICVRYLDVDEKMLFWAISKKPSIIKHIEKPSDKMLIAAFTKKPKLIYSFNNLSEDVQVWIATNHPEFVASIINICKKAQEVIIDKYPQYVMYLKTIDPELINKVKECNKDFRMAPVYTPPSTVQIRDILNVGPY